MVFKVVAWPEAKPLKAELEKRGFNVRAFPYRSGGLNRPLLRKLEIIGFNGNLPEKLRGNRHLRECFNDFSEVILNWL